MPWDESVDVLVVGSGCAGQCAALRASDLGLDVLVVEKQRHWGGNTAMSAGALWVPANHWMRAAGIDDSEDEGVKYLVALTGGEVPENRLRTFVRESNRMVEYLDEHSHVHFTALTRYPDYHDDVPGGRPGGRPLKPQPIDGSRLGDDFATLHQAYPGELMLGKFMMSVPEARGLLDPGLAPMRTMAKGMLKYLLRGRKRKRLGGRDPWFTMGQALMTRLRLSLRDRGVPMWLDAPLSELVSDGGRVTGAVMRHAWWTPAVRPPGLRYGSVMVIEKSLPHGIFVNRLGTRFTNEAASYTAVVQAMYADDAQTGASVPCWWVLDATYRKRFPIGPVAPGMMMNDAKVAKRFPPWAPGAGWLHKADTLEALAREIDVDAATLRATVDRFNEGA